MSDPTPAPTPRPKNRRRHLAATFGLAVVLAGSIAACGSGGGGTDDVASLAAGESAGGTSTTEAAPMSEEEIQEAQEQFQQCMKDHGVDIQIAVASPSGDEGGFVTNAEVGGPGEAPDPEDMPSKEEMDAAEADCHHFIEKVVQNAPKPDPEEEARMQQQALDFARCMREHGVDMPDPTFDEGRISVTIGKPGDEPDPDMDAAQQACQELMKGPNGEMPTPGGGPVSKSGSVGSDRAGGE